MAQDITLSAETRSIRSIGREADGEQPLALPVEPEPR
jgi:hypothetical protein